jgi:hypothetical protein
MVRAIAAVALLAAGEARAQDAYMMTLKKA